MSEAAAAAATSATPWKARPKGSSPGSGTTGSIDGKPGEGSSSSKRARANTAGAKVGGEAEAEGDSGAGVPKSNRRNRRKRRTNPGRKCEDIKSKDKHLHYFLGTMAKLVLQTATNTRLALGILLTTVIGDKNAEPFAAAAKEQQHFKDALREARQESERPVLGPPHHQIFHSFVAALAELDVGGAVRKVLQEWLQKLEDAGAAAPKSIELVCQTFQCFPVRADAQRIRLQFALVQGPIRVAILNALDAADCR